MTSQEQAARAAAEQYLAARTKNEQIRARDALWSAVGGRTAMGHPIYWLPAGGTDRITCHIDRAARLWAAQAQEEAV